MLLPICAILVILTLLSFGRSIYWRKRALALQASRDSTDDTPLLQSGGPYRLLANTNNDENESEDGAENEKVPDPDHDAEGRLRWKGKNCFECQVCGCTKCSDHLQYEEPGILKVTCKGCRAVINYGMMHESPVYRKTG